MSATSEDPFTNDDDRGLVKSLHKALAILEAVSLAEFPPRVAEVALQVGVPRPTAHRVAQTLIAEGYLTQDPHSGRLSIASRYWVCRRACWITTGCGSRPCRTFSRWRT